MLGKYWWVMAANAAMALFMAGDIGIVQARAARRR